MEVPAPRQMTPELAFGGGMATLVGLIFYNVWHHGSEEIWVFITLSCAVFIGSFSVFYLLGYYVIFKKQ